MFKKNGEILNANNVQHYLNLLKKQKYVKNELVSPERFAHIILRHGSENCQKSFFNNFCGDRLLKEIQSTVSDKANYIGKDGDTDFYVKTFNEVVGFDEHGNPIHELLVVVKDGKVITSYPPRKRNLEILLDKCVKPAANLAA